MSAIPPQIVGKIAQSISSKRISESFQRKCEIVGFSFEGLLPAKPREKRLQGCILFENPKGLSRLTDTRLLEIDFNAKGKEKLKIHNLIGLAGDTLSASSYIADLAKQSGKEIPLTKSLPKSLEHITKQAMAIAERCFFRKIDKLISPSSMKVIARFGIIGVTANAINELNNIDPEKNEDYFCQRRS